jgi:hypothetical protein
MGVISNAVKKKIRLFLFFVGFVAIGLICYELLFSRTNLSVVKSVSGLELDDTYHIQTIQDDWADPTSMNGEGSAFFKVNLTAEQCSSLVNEATKLHYRQCPIVYTGSMGLPPKIAGITNGIYRNNIGAPDDRDVDISVVDLSHKILYVYVRIM